MTLPASELKRRRPNEQLRAQRLRRGWSLDDTARALVELAIRLGERLPGVTGTMVGRWERGEHTPRPPYPRLLCLLFELPAEALGLSESEAAPAKTGRVTGAGESPAALYSVAARPVERPLHISEVTVHNLEAVTAAYRRMYHTVGAHDLIDGVAQHVLTTRGFWRRASDPAFRRSLAATTSEIAMLAGRMSFFDLGRPSEAEPHYQTALEAAQEAEDRALQAVVLGNKSFIARNAGDFAGALHLLGRAKALAADELTVRSWATALEAMTQAWAQQPSLSLEAMEKAEIVLAEARADQRPAWFDYYDHSRLAGFKGLMRIRLNQPDAAQASLDEAITALTPDAAKQRACYLADQATVYANEGQVEEACELGMQALAILETVEYATGVQRVRDLRARLKPYHNHAAVADLTEQLLLVS